MTLSEDRIKEIRDGCEGVTPGPWREGVDGNQRIYGPDNAGEFSGLIASFVRRFDLAHISRLDPQTVAALCDEVLAARKEIKRMREALAFYAVRENWLDIPQATGCGGPAPAHIDGGRRARAALGGGDG